MLDSFDATKKYLSNPAVLVSLRQGSSFSICLSVLDNAFGFIFGHYDEKRKKE